VICVVTKFFSVKGKKYLQSYPITAQIKFLPPVLKTQ
jgi:hypothetical protein